jgi:hypothetical protein
MNVERDKLRLLTRSEYNANFKSDDESDIKNSFQSAFTIQTMSLLWCTKGHGLAGTGEYVEW